MKFAFKFIAALVFSALLIPNLAYAQHYTETILVSNIPVTGQTPVLDPNLQNVWGLVASPSSPWWTSNNANGTSTLYDATGLTLVPATPITIVPINGNGIVTIPSAPSQNGAPGSPTGIMFNGNPADFRLPSGDPAAFIYVTEDGTVQGWAGGTAATIVVDNSIKPDAANGAVYKGATIVEMGGKRFILAANFRSGRVDIFDSKFHQVHVSKSTEDEDEGRSSGAFDDDSVPDDYAPFNIQGIGPNVYITYAKQNVQKHDPVGGNGFGFVDVFSNKGKLLQRLEHGSWFNAPWGIVLTPAEFGEFSHTILVGNFRSGTIAAFNPLTGRFLGNVLNPDGSVTNIDGLWALTFGNESGSGPAHSLFFTAGPNNEKDGLLGTLTPIDSELQENNEQ